MYNRYGNSLNIYLFVPGSFNDALGHSDEKVLGTVQ
jgi:hypothetical protein